MSGRESRCKLEMCSYVASHVRSLCLNCMTEQGSRWDKLSVSHTALWRKTTGVGWAEKMLQMGCEVYIQCPLLNRLPLMKCLMLRLSQSNSQWQFISPLPKKPTTLWPSLATLTAKHREVPGLNKARQCVIWHANVGHCICKCVITNLHAKTH